MRKQQTVNPFILSNFSIPIVYKDSYYGATSNENTKHSTTKIIKSSSDITVSQIIDAEKNTKIYSSAKLFELFRVLSSPAKDLFMYIATKLPKDQDYLEFRDVDYAKIVEKSVRSVRLWRRELIWVMQSRSGRVNTYWINPAILFSGNRITQFPEEYYKPLKSIISGELPDPFESL